MEVKDKYYEEVRDWSVSDLVKQIVLIKDDDTEVVVESTDTADDKKFESEVQHAEDRIKVWATVSPSHSDVPTGTYVKSRLEMSDGSDLTEEIDHTAGTIEDDRDELVSEHFVEIPE